VLRQRDDGHGPPDAQGRWGFNGTERPGAVYLAAVLAGHNQKGLPAFGIYGREVQDAGDQDIPLDVREKLLRFARAGLAVAMMRGKSYLSIGGVSMGIAGSIVDQPFFEQYLGMRVESVDMSEVTRRIAEGIYDPDEFERALGWVKGHCKEGKDYNPPQNRRSAAAKEEDWRTVVKMTLIVRDLMIGNPRLEALGFGEEALGHNAIAGGFQGQRAWTDHSPNGDFTEAVLNSSFDWNGVRMPYMLATENDCLNGVGMLMGYLLTNTAQIFADVRTYWSPEAVKRVTGHTLTGPTSGGLIHLINSGRRHARWHRRAVARRQARNEALLGDQFRRGEALPGSHNLATGHRRILPRRRLLFVLPLARGDADDDDPPEPGEGPRPRAPDRRGPIGRPPPRGPRRPQRADQPHLADDLVRAEPDWQGAVHRRLQRDEPLERPTTAPSATATSVPTSSRWPRCCGSRSPCTTCPTTVSSARAPGASSALSTRRGRLPGVRQLRTPLRLNAAECGAEMPRFRRPQPLVRPAP